MKTFLRHFCSIFIFAFCFSHLQPAFAASDQDRSQFTIELRDGSRLVGKDLGETLDFHSSTLGNFKLTWSGIRSIEYVTTNIDVAQLTTTNSDVFAVQFVNSTLRVETDFGTKELPVKLIRSIKVLWKSKIQLPSGLVSLWSGESNAVDSVGGNNGKLKGKVTYDNGRIGQAFGFGGGKDWVDVGNPTNLQLQDFTITTWIERDNTSHVSDGFNRNAMIFCHGAGGYGLFLNPSGLPEMSKIGVNGSSSSKAITDTGWHHLAVTKSGSTVVFYVDGIAYPAQAFDQKFDFSNNVSIGGKNQRNWECTFAGLIDEVAIYNRALTAPEIQTIYADQNQAPLPPPLKSKRNVTTIDGTLQYEIRTTEH